ncbi:MAG: putative DNA modification/repair radical SAM protein [Eubacteriales bacterium]
MDLIDKLEILGAAAKYDASCASSGSARKGKTGMASMPGICHSWAADGRCISLLKILMDNRCLYNCAYCKNSNKSDTQRAGFEPHEVYEITMNFYKRNYIEGLFLSSSIIKSPDYTMEKMIKCVELLRKNEFGGYIHLKAIPGASKDLIERAGFLVDRMSVNVEMPTSQSLMLLAPEKSKENIFLPMGQIAASINANKNNYLDKDKFVPAGQSTQMIIGATSDSDHQILKLSQYLYRHYELKRVYFSAFVPVTKNPLLPVIDKPPLLREHRLYQADWLMRFYGFDASEILDEKYPMLDNNLDPKCVWALRHREYFPIDVNKASLWELLRVPGIGNISARRIITARRMGSLGFADLKKIGVVLKRARYFITCSGKHEKSVFLSTPQVYNSLLVQNKMPALPMGAQTSMFDAENMENAKKIITGVV